MMVRKLRRVSFGSVCLMKEIQTGGVWTGRGWGRVGIKG
jgi:hypothetical protein